MKVLELPLQHKSQLGLTHKKEPIRLVVRFWGLFNAHPVMAGQYKGCKIEM